jgi:tyrosine-protein phosphatase SIW14
MRSFGAFCFFLFSSTVVLPASLRSSAKTASAEAIGQKISIPGVPNAGKVTDHLYRGAQPRLSYLGALKKLGVTVIIDLRAEAPQAAREEQSLAESAGIRFFHIPIGGFSNPTNSDLIQFFQILSDSARQTVFVHCEFGRDRTGVMIAAYRIAFQKWSSDHALSEMNSFGFNRLWHPSMVSYVRNLPARLQSEPDLKKTVEPTPD